MNERLDVIGTRGSPMEGSHRRRLRAKQEHALASNANALNQLAENVTNTSGLDRTRDENRTVQERVAPGQRSHASNED